VLLAFCFSFIQMVLAGDLKPLTEPELAQKLRQYQSISTLEATFKQTKTIRKMDVVINSEGHFKVTRPTSLDWQVVKPSPVVISMDDQQVKIVTDGETQVFKLKELPSDNVAQSLKGLFALLDLNATELYRHYDVFSERNGFKFIPKQGDGSPFKSLIMSFDKSAFVRKVEIKEISGDSIVIEFGIPKVVSKKS
jgi:outer membrane lipoprotein-sorting protein